MQSQISSAQLLITIGSLLLVGLLAHQVGKKTHVPRVTLLLLIGALISPNAFNIIPIELQSWFPYISQISLCMVGFLLGEQFVYHTFIKSSKGVWSVTIFESLFAALLVFFTLYLLDVPIVIAILLAGIAPASAPAATLDVIKQTGVNGKLPKMLMQVVAIDDALGIFIFAFCLAIAEFFIGSPSLIFGLIEATWEVFGAVAIGIIVGWPMAKITGRLKDFEPTTIEALGFVLFTGGLAELLGTSYLLSSITLGIMVANFAKHHSRPFHAIEGISTPFLIIFFIMAGLQFDIGEIELMGVVSIAYIISRSIGLVLGSYIGATIGKSNDDIKHHLGYCLLPQAGVALGMALLVAERFPHYSAQIMTTLVGTTIIFELFGPIVARYHLLKAQKTPVETSKKEERL